MLRVTMLLSHAMDSWTSFVPIMVQRQLTNQILAFTVIGGSALLLCSGLNSMYYGRNKIELKKD